MPVLPLCPLGSSTACPFPATGTRVRSIHSGHLQKPEHRRAHIRRSWKCSMLCLTNPQEQTGELQWPFVLRPRPACPSIQAVATSSTLSVSAPHSTGTDVSGADLGTAGVAGGCTGEPGHRPSTPSGRCPWTLHPGHITQGAVPPVLEWGWEGQLCIKGVGRTCLYPQEVTEATARPFKEKPSAT